MLCSNAPSAFATATCQQSLLMPARKSNSINTHQDMHPVPMSYDEELQRVIATATMAKTALPNAKVAAPSTCAWWYCTSVQSV